MSSSAAQVYEFGPFRLDTRERVLSRSGAPVSLTPKAYEVLLVLVRQAGHIVEKEELMKKVWADAFVEEGNLTHHIFALRRALTDGGGSEYIETIPRRGYRFVVPVREVSAAARPVKHDLPAGRFKGLAIVVLVVVGVALGGLGLYKYFAAGGHAPSANPSPASMEAKKITSNSRATTAALSPDGKYVVYSRDEAGQQSLWLKQIATLNEVQIVPAADVTYYGSTFTRDGVYIFYVMEERNRSTGVYQVAAVGGSPMKIDEHLDSAVTLSPDGNRLAFVRLNQSQSDLIVVNTDGTGERRVATRNGAEWFDHFVGIAPAWSPDGKVIACSVGGEVQGHQYHSVAAVDVESGKQRILTSLETHAWPEVGQVAWRKDGEAIVFIADGQIWQLAYPSGDARKITNDANKYIGISLDAESDSLVTVQLELESTIWVMPSGDAEKARAIASGRREGYQGLAWTPENRIVFDSVASGDLDIWSMGADGSDRKQLTAKTGGENYVPCVSGDGRYIVFASTRTGKTHIWRMNTDGSGAKQLTTGLEERSPECSADGKWVVYVSFVASTVQNLWKVPIDGGDPVPLSNLSSNVPAISPDGKLIAFRSGDSKEQPFRLTVMSFPDGKPVKEFDIPSTTIMSGDYKTLRWTRDSRSLAYLDTRSGTTNIWSRQLDSGVERQLTDFKSDQMFRFDWSRDGKYLAVTRGSMIKNVILIKGF
jgi:Tol biopolymer transport system component/DNA-binding winged helix-turn-helix (wHTH) protein